MACRQPTCLDASVQVDRARGAGCICSDVRFLSCRCLCWAGGGWCTQLLFLVHWLPKLFREPKKRQNHFASRWMECCIWLQNDPFCVVSKLSLDDYNYLIFMGFFKGKKHEEKKNQGFDFLRYSPTSPKSFCLNQHKFSHKTILDQSKLCRLTDHFYPFTAGGVEPPEKWSLDFSPYWSTNPLLTTAVSASSHLLSEEGWIISSPPLNGEDG